MNRPQDWVWERISRIVDDCEAYQSSGDSEYKKEQEKITAYNHIAELLKKEKEWEEA